MTTIGLDLGPSGCRAPAIDDAGAGRAMATAAVWQHPRRWWEAPRPVLSELANRLPAACRLARAIEDIRGEEPGDAVIARRPLQALTQQAVVEALPAGGEAVDHALGSLLVRISGSAWQID